MTALYALAAEYREAAERMADLDLPAETIQDTLESMSGELQEKATTIAQMTRNLEALCDQIKAAEQKMVERRKAYEARAESMRDYLLRCMTDAGITRIESPWFALAVKRNPPSVVLDDLSLIPLEYMRMLPPPPPAIDKVAIKSAIESGHDVPGARVVRGQRLEIK